MRALVARTGGHETHALPDRKITAELAAFADFGRRTEISEIEGEGFRVPVFTNEFWTSKQRSAHPIHEVSYRACFKPQLPRFFIERLTAPGELVYDPFMGRGTTLVEAMLLGRRAAGCDVNPLSRIFTAPRLDPPALAEIEHRLSLIDFTCRDDFREELLVFFHPETLAQITALRRHLRLARDAGAFDRIDAWIEMVAINRLTGHSPGFFSVYTLPPNQAVSIESQRRINARRGQAPEPRDVRSLILKKSRQLLSQPVVLDRNERPLLLTRSSNRTPELASNSVHLVVTSPPFLDVVDYARDNWLRAWFCGIDLDRVPIWLLRNVGEWELAMQGVLRELYRVVCPGGYIAFEVGEVKNGKVLLEHHVISAGQAAGFVPELVLINRQEFTKTANCWGVANNTKGTNTNRVVVFRRLT